jgi:hypothetical protein
MTGFNMTGFELFAAAVIVSAGMATPVFAQARPAPGMQVAMATPAHGKMMRHGKRHMSHHAAAHGYQARRSIRHEVTG